MRALLILFVLSGSLFSATHKDMLGRSVEIADNKKIVCIGPGALRLAVYMGLQDRVVGIEKLELELDFDLKSAYRAALNKDSLSKLHLIGQGGPGQMPNIEALINLKPDFILSSFLSAEQVNMIQEKTKIQVVALSYGSTYGGSKGGKKLHEVKESLVLIGEIADKKERAKELLAFMEKEESALATLVKNDKKLYIAGIGYKGAQGITSTESDYPPFSLLGLENALMSGKSGHAFIQEESIIAYNPDVIFFDLLGQKIIKGELEGKRALFDSLNAFKKKRLYWLYPYNFYNTNIENIYINSYIIAHLLGVESVDVDAKKAEIYTLFLGKEAAETLKSIKLPSF